MLRARLLVVAALVALVSCATGPDGKLGGSNVVLRADRRETFHRVEAPKPPAPPEPERKPVAVAPPVMAGDLVDDRLPPPVAATEHAPKPWPFDVLHYALDVGIVPETRSILGSVTIDVSDAADGLAELPLDAVGMTISGVAELAPETQTVSFAYDGRVLLIPLGEPRRSGTARRFRVDYAATPERGLYFNEGDPLQVYTQGEMEDSRHWFPCHDAPDDRATHSLRVEGLRRGWPLVAAGAGSVTEISTDALPDARTARFDVPHVSYLISMTTGDYEVIDERGVVPLQFVVERRDAEFARANFRKTDAVLRFFGDFTGLAYPYPKYSQTTVRNFMFGGMENIGATTLTDATIHPPDWEPARDSVSLVAHEAAHQWFGDWITCSFWSDNWLNEGFASYFDLLFTEHDEGRDAFLWRLRGERHGALGAMDGERRAVVSNRWADPLDMFDGHAYAGGAVRLHMLRHHLGDEQFRGAVRHYVKTCGLSCVATDDFQRAVEEFTGQDLGWFFDQWFRRPGYPKLEVRWKWDEAKKAVVVTVEQTQKAEGGVPEAYRLALDLAFDPHHPPLTKRRLAITKRSETFEIPMASSPASLRVDPETALLARFDVERTIAQWADTFSSAHNPALSMDAAEALAGIVRDEKRAAADRDGAFAALKDAFAREEFAPLRAALAGQLASRKDDVSADALIAALAPATDLRVRLAALGALDGFSGNEKAVAAVRAHLDDPNDLVRAAAVTGIAKLKAAGAYDALVAALDRPGWQSVARVAALRGFADLGDERGFPLLVKYAAPGDNWSRAAAIDSLGRMGKSKSEYPAAVLRYLDDRERHVRQAAADALGKIQDADTLAALVAHFHTETWPSTKEALRNAVKSVRGAAVESGRLVSVEAVRAAPIRQKHGDLRDETDALAESIKKLDGDAKKDAEVKLKALRDAMAPLQKDLDALGVPHRPRPKAATAPSAR